MSVLSFDPAAQRGGDTFGGDPKPIVDHWKRAVKQRDEERRGIAKSMTQEAIKKAVQNNLQPSYGDVSPPATCSEKANSVNGLIYEGKEKLDKMIGEMGKRIRTHKDISKRVLDMKTELERLRISEETLSATTTETLARKKEALESINSCKQNVDDMEKAMEGLLATIEALKAQIISQDSEYDLTYTRLDSELKDAGFPPRLDAGFD